MQVINGKGIAWNNDIDFYTKVIDIDFYNSTNRRLHLGHVNDCNFTLLRLIMPKEYNGYNVVMRFKPNNSEAHTFEPKNVVENVSGYRYFSITGDCTEKTSQGYIQFVVQCISNNNKIVQATSNKIPYIIEETLESGDPSSFTPEETTILEELRDSIQVLTNNVNMKLSNKADKATVNAQLAGKVDSSVYNQKIEEIEEVLDGKANYINNIDVDNCNTPGSIYRVLIHYDSEDIGAIVIPSRSNRSDLRIAQFAFTANGKILCRKTDNGTWSYEGTDGKNHKIEFVEIGGISE